MVSLSGIHHVAIVAANVRSTHDFYTRALGMTLVGRTVDFDQPDVLQLYFGDARGSPGSLLSFLIQPEQQRGRVGIGHVSAVSMAVPRGSLPIWRQRLAQSGVSILGRAWSFHEEHLCFSDPHGLELSLVEDDDIGGAVARPAKDGPGITRIRAIEVQTDALQPAARFLESALGFQQSGHSGAATRFRSGSGSGTGQGAIDLLATPRQARGSAGAGIVSHVAWRVADIATLERTLVTLIGQGIETTPILDRMYFHAAYFRGLGGVLLAIATDGPGFAMADEKGGGGDRLALPDWLEPKRGEIERRLKEPKP